MTDDPYDYIAEAITAHWGERCPDHEATCPCCAAWAQYDALRTPKTPPIPLALRVRQILDEHSAYVSRPNSAVDDAVALAAMCAAVAFLEAVANDPA